MKPINSWDRCPYCEHRFTEAEAGEFVLVTKARFDWLVSGAEQNIDAQGDDDWVDWMSEGDELSRKLE